MDLGEGRYRQATAPWEGLANGFIMLFEAILQGVGPGSAS